MPSEYESPRQPLIKKMFFGDSALRRIALEGLVAFAIGFVRSELTKEMTMRPRPFAVFDHARLLSADVGLISLPEAYRGYYDD